MNNTGTSSARRIFRAAQLSLLLAFGALLSACGGGGAGDSGFTTGVGPGPAPGGSQPLQIMTTSVPDGSVGATYAPTQLSASGASGALAWSVVDGTLPPGMAVTSDGTLFGTPLATGFYLFTVEATDGIGQDAQALAVSVETFGAHLASGLQFGEAWSHRDVVIDFAGSGATPQVTMPQNGSGGSVVSIDLQAGTVTYRPGPVYGTSTNDVVRITDPTTNEHVDIPLVVRPDPHAEHVARFGATDVWKIDFHAKTGSHAYATDWHECLARLGLRNPGSTNATGTEADRLCDMVARTLLLRNLNALFLRQTNGAGGAQGLAISFPYEDLDGYGTPTPGSYVAGQPYVYNVMSLNSYAAYGVFGMAYIDSANNAQIENNAPGGAHGHLGVFVNRITDFVSSIYSGYGTQLTDTPVHDGDIEALKALLFESGSTGGRYAMLAYTIDGLARSVAAVTAHEIGHSLGLHHTPLTVPGSLMNVSAAISPAAQYAFLPADIARLQTALAGPGRGIGQLLKVGSGFPEGGVCVCQE